MRHCNAITIFAIGVAKKHKTEIFEINTLKLFTQTVIEGKYQIYESGVRASQQCMDEEDCPVPNGVWLHSSGGKNILVCL